MLAHLGPHDLRSPKGCLDVEKKNSEIFHIFPPRAHARKSHCIIRGCVLNGTYQVVGLRRSRCRSTRFRTAKATALRLDVNLNPCPAVNWTWQWKSTTDVDSRWYIANDSIVFFESLLKLTHVHFHVGSPYSQKKINPPSQWSSGCSSWACGRWSFCLWTSLSLRYTTFYS